jgi:hypothetical protein
MRVVPVEGIEPPLLAEHDFESSAVCYKFLILLLYFGIVLCMCKRLCKKTSNFYPHLASADGPWARTIKGPEGPARGQRTSVLEGKALEFVPASRLREIHLHESVTSQRPALPRRPLQRPLRKEGRLRGPLVSYGAYPTVHAALAASKAGRQPLPASAASAASALRFFPPTLAGKRSGVRFSPCPD